MNAGELRSSISIGILTLICLIITFPALSTPEQSSYHITNAKKILVRASIIDIKPLKVSSDVSVIGGQISTPEKRTLGIDASYFFSDNISLEMQAGIFSRDYAIRNSRLGAFSIGTVESNSISAIMQYHFDICCQLMPYVGLGINHAWTRKVKPSPGVPKFEVKDVNSLILNAGLNYAISESWMVNLSEYYIMSPEYNFSGYGVNAKVKMNTLVTAIGLAYSF